MDTEGEKDKKKSHKLEEKEEKNMDNNNSSPLYQELGCRRYYRDFQKIKTKN